LSQQAFEIAGSPGSMARERIPPGAMPCTAAALRLRDGRYVRVRPSRPADAEAIQDFVRRLSATSRKLRFFSTMHELGPAMLARLTEPAGRGQVVIAETCDRKEACMVAMAQYATGDRDGSCELALVVADAYQGLGLGRALMEILLELARGARYERAVVDVSCYNDAMLALARAYGFATVHSPHGATMLRLELDLGMPADMTTSWSSPARPYRRAEMAAGLSSAQCTRIASAPSQSLS
jgi:GNAT superfamily N-acetyltransferase